MLDLPIFYVFFYYIIIWSKTFKKIKSSTALCCRRLSGKIYYVHMYFVALCAIVLMGEDSYNNFYSFLIVVSGSCLLSWFFIRIENNIKHVD